MPIGNWSQAVYNPDSPIYGRPTGGEVSTTVVVDRTTVRRSSVCERIVEPGVLLCRITASGKYGPYSTTATDGRQTVTPPVGGQVQSVIAERGVNVTLDDAAVGGLYHNCVFDLARVKEANKTEDLGISGLEAAFPTCVFRDD